MQIRLQENVKACEEADEQALELVARINKVRFSFLPIVATFSTCSPQDSRRVDEIAYGRDRGLDYPDGGIHKTNSTSVKSLYVCPVSIYLSLYPFVVLFHPKKSVSPFLIPVSKPSSTSQINRPSCRILSIHEQSQSLSHILRLRTNPLQGPSVVHVPKSEK